VRLCSGSVRGQRWMALLVAMAAVLLVGSLVSGWRSDGDRHPAPGEAPVERLFPIASDQRGAVVLDTDRQVFFAVDPHGTVLWSTKPVPAIDQFVVCGRNCSEAVLSSSASAWYQPDVPDPLPRTVSATGERPWSIPKTQKMRVLAGSGAHDALVLRMDAAGTTWVEVRAPGVPPVKVEAATSNLDWTLSPSGTAGVLYEYNNPSGHTAIKTFIRTSKGWRLQSRQSTPRSARGMCIGDDGRDLLVLGTSGEIIAQRGRPRRLNSDLPVGACLVTDQIYVLIQRRLQGGQRTTSIRAFRPNGQLAWSSEAAEEQLVSVAPRSGDTMLSGTRGTVVRHQDGTWRELSVPDAATAYRRDGRILILGGDGTVTVGDRLR
jgi:hypothetical protein